ncbi:MAG: tetratricopeptide repeat protein [Caldisericaceae bacterium]|nr:tetratricopeptide repeat protein [Caldisericaceae bacterium]
MEKQNTLEIARKYLSNQNYKKAKETYLQALKEATDDQSRAFIWAELSWTFYHLQSFQSCIEAAENCLNLNADYQAKEDLYRLIGFSYMALGQDQPAIENLEQSLRIDRNSVKQQYAIFNLAKLYFKHQKYPQAEELLNEVEGYFFQNNRDYWLSVLYMKGFVKYYQDQLDEAEKIFEELLEHAGEGKQRATGLFGLAFIAFDRKDYLKTINLCEATAKLDENFFDKETLGFLTAVSFHRLGRNDVFEKYYQQMIKTYPQGRYRKELDDIKAKINN